MFETTNCTAWSSMKERLLETSAHVVMGQELKILDHDVVEAARWAHTHGWKSAITPALRTEREGVSSGTAIFARKAIGMEQVIEDSWVLVPGRATAAKLCMGPKGGMVVISVYLIDSIGPVEENWQSLLRVAEFISSLEVPWICGADWNCSSVALAESGWLQLVGGCVLAGPDSIGTCRTRSGWYSNIDYFVVPVTLEPAVSFSRVVMGSFIKTHRPVQVCMVGQPRQLMVRKLKPIAQFPQQPPAYPSRCPHTWPSRVPPVVSGLTAEGSQQVLDDTCRYVMDNVEKELIGLYDVPEVEAPSHCGRGEPPKYQWLPSLGTTVQGHALRLGPAGRWWRALAEGMKDAMRLLCHLVPGASACGQPEDSPKAQARYMQLQGIIRHLKGIVATGSVKAEVSWAARGLWGMRLSMLEGAQCQPWGPAVADEWAAELEGEYKAHAKRLAAAIKERFHEKSVVRLL